MKKIIALALALIMALSMASVAFAAATLKADYEDLITFADADAANKIYYYDAAAKDMHPGETYEFYMVDWLTAGQFTKDALKNYKITKVDFTTGDLQGASLIDSVKITKEKDAIRLALKESYTMAEEADKVVKGEVTYTIKGDDNTYVIRVNLTVNNEVEPISGSKKVADVAANSIWDAANTVFVMDEDGGYVSFTEGELTGTFKMAADSKAYLEFVALTEDEQDALDAYLGEDYEGIVEQFNFATKAAEDVAFRYDAWEEDPHYFYAWDGEKLTAIDAKYDADEDVDDYVFTADAVNTILVVDEEIVLAEEETKNPDTGANDVVGVAAALAVVSLVAAGAVSLKK